MARKTSLSPFLISAAGFSLAAYVRLIRHTRRWDVINKEAHERLLASGKPFIYAAWHGRLLMLPTVHVSKTVPLTGLASAHKDGDFVSAFLNQFNVGTVRGSSADPRKPDRRKGGSAGLRQLIRATRAGHRLALTPDGPRGPRQRAHPGIAQLASMTGIPILPLAFSAQHAKQLKSWDKFVLPYPVPFARGTFAFGDPITVSATTEDELEAARQHIEQRMNDLTAQADQAMGLTPNAPAPLVATDEQAPA